MPKRNSKQQQRLITTVVTVLIILAILIVQYVQGGLDLGALLSSLTGAPTPTVSAESNGEPGKFDFYILALSWSPDYCATSAGASDPQQCSIGRKLGFVLHGLWPQYNQGYPSNCSTARMPADVKAKFPLLYPSPKLYDHEWEKHGTCTGLTPDAYLTLSQQIKNSVVIPAAYRAPEQPLRVTTAQLKREFTSANPGLREGSLATMCSGSGRYLQELYVCFFSDGTPATCSTEIHRDAARSCGQADFLVRNIK